MSGQEEFEHNISIDGITLASYDMAKHLWNTYYGYSADSLHFLYFMIRKWEELRTLYYLALDCNQPSLLAAPYGYYRNMIIVGAQSELERVRGRWPSNSDLGTATVRCLRVWRIRVASEYSTEPLIPDNEAEYYTDSGAVQSEQASEQEN